MNQPKFSVGEQVIVVPINGNSQYEAVVKAYEFRKNHVTARSKEPLPAGFVYWLDHFPNGSGNPKVEILLRKKYPPSTQSFTELMEEIKKVTA